MTTVAIIGILASMAMAAIYVAQERAKEVRTISMIGRLNYEISARYELYRTRKLPVDASRGRDPGNSAVNNSGVLKDPDSNVRLAWDDSYYVNAAGMGVNGYGDRPNHTTQAQQVSLKSLYARRELMRRELPDRYQDLIVMARNGMMPAGVPLGFVDLSNAASVSSGLPPPECQFTQSNAFAPTECYEPLFLMNELPAASITQPPAAPSPITQLIPLAPPLMLAYQKQVNRALIQLYQQGLAGDTTSGLQYLAREYESAECLYMIFSATPPEDFTGRSLFNENETGDVDNDGMKEFIDGWGKPIEWIRWPAGFVSALQPAISPPSPSDPAPTTYYINTVPQRDVANNRDGFDSRGVSIFLYNADSPGQSRRVNVPPDDDGTTADDLFANAASVPNSQNWSWGFYTTPLIVSSGPDKQFGLLFDRRGLTYPNPHPDPYMSGANAAHLLTDASSLSAIDRQHLRKLADPYSLHPYTTDGTTLSYGQIGTIINSVSGGGNVEQVHLDNIDNHSLEVR